MTEGYDGDPKLSTLFAVERPIGRDKGKTHVVEGPIRFTDLCEYHVLPIRGSALVGYLAAETLIGIPKLAPWQHMRRQQDRRTQWRKPSLRFPVRISIFCSYKMIWSSRGYPGSKTQDGSPCLASSRSRNHDFFSRSW